MKRIFLAVKTEPEPELLDLFDLLRDELAGEQIKWVTDEQFHITLKFFGDKTEEQINDISAVVRSCCARMSRFSFQLVNPWYFRDRDRLRVVLLQTAKTDQLTALQKELENGLAETGIPKEDRAFRAHLTLGRIKSVRDPQHFYELMKQFPQKPVQTVNVNEVILFESILKPAGPEYLALEKFRLAGKV
mgnify:CR=1 FL=1